MFSHLEKVQPRGKKNIQKLPLAYFPGPAMSNLQPHRATPTYSRIAYPGLKEKKVLEVLQKLTPGPLSKEHHDRTTEVFSTRKYQYHHSKQDSRDKNYFPASNLSIRYSLRQYNQKRSIRNHQLQRDYQQHPSTHQKLPWHK